MLYVKYKSPVIYRSLYDNSYFILKKKPIKIPIFKSNSTPFKERIKAVEPIKVNFVENEKEKPSIASPIDTLGSVASSLTLASVTVFIRYFVVVDILINLFGKINVDFGPRISNMVDLLKRLEFPNLNFAQHPSPIDDGGNESIKDHEEYLKNLSNKNETFPNKNKV